ncbi:2-keto-3-deoxy-L-rhamnonate aldolase RhmA [Pseudomonas cedrina]|uniref:Aldolase n=2 Tax=Pseudomonas cedrina TaxID=651740 RepID=A0A1V2JYF0_PSECE|nr:aldolase/citrate lyase family protein [Pseudomonas cedrina]ONH49856.1 aldolase [Pseudomonas cedrina subsp. cedrina]SDT07037.1 2-keto-3-deoxy-L-rhamnonate aldolase RhmA [Pseudomonas cedrina]
MSSLTLRQRLLAGERLLSSFIKTPAHASIEIAGIAGLDAVVLDAEHAGFSSTSLDIGLLACQAAAIPGLVRVADNRPATLLQALDLGAAGLVLPHVTSAAQAHDIVAATRYREGHRGFSNSPRAGGYGLMALARHIDFHDGRAAVICQIEDAAALDHLDAIANVDGVDCLFVGRADLAVSLRHFDLNHEVVEQAVIQTLQAARRAGKAAGLFVAHINDVERYAAHGAAFFIVGSDQAVLRKGWSEQVERFHNAASR